MGNFVQWHEGMLLSPHHFQQSDSNIQHLLSQIGASSSAFFYGVYNLTVDTLCLSSGVIRILKTNGIFQDGYCFSFDAVRDHPLEKNLSEYFIANSAPIKIYLCMPARRTGENELEGDMARYYSDEIANINDNNTGENAINIPILKPKLRLMTSDEVDARYVGFPIFEAVKSASGGVVNTKFLPPFISIDERSKISEMCRDISQIIRSKVSYFSDKKDNTKSTVTDESMTNLRILIQAVLPLEAVIRINGIQPFEVYKYLLDAITKVISINPTQLIPTLPIYDHEHLFETFDTLQEYARKILNALKQEYDIIHFAKEGPIFKLKMQREWLEKGELAIGLQKTFSSTEDDLLNWIRGAQIASESMIPMLRDRRVLGAERSIMERGAYITQPNNMKIIGVNAKSPYIKPSEKLCLVNMSHKIMPEGATLYVDCG